MANMNKARISEDHHAVLRSLIRPDEILTPDSPEFQRRTQTWAFQKQLNPSLVIRPRSAESLSKSMVYLYSTDLDIGIYGQGFMSASAKDVLINMSAFNDFHFDQHSELATIGAGQTWSEVYHKLAEVAPEYGIVGARTPFVGVAGTIIYGGISWLSSEYGCISDPANMLDAKVVKYDGSAVWASAEPELLWALRGGGGGFGVVTHVVLRVFPYPQEIWSGPILVPREQLKQVAEGIAKFLSQPLNPKISMLLYVVKKRVLESIGTDSDMLVIHAFDALGEVHGRINFQWALNIPGAIDQTKINTLVGVANLQDKTYIIKGSMKQFWAPLMIRDLSAEIIIKAVRWAEEIRELDESVADCTYLIFELLSSCEPAGPLSDCAWPRPAGAKHILLLGPGCPSDAGPGKEKLVRDLACQAASRVLGQDADIHYLPNGFEDFHDARKTWGHHFQKLQTARRHYDPRNKFKGAINTGNA